MNGSYNFARSLMQDLLQASSPSNAAEMVVCPPAVYLQYVSEMLADATSISLGAQNASEHPSGAYTGEVSTLMLKELGCKYVITGHSERRQYYGEDDAEVARKSLAVVDQGMVPIACVGETLAERENNQARMVVERQLDAVLNLIPVDRLENFAVAYEPVWAIGTGKVASPEQAQEVHEWIRLRLGAKDSAFAQRCPILYGGSVNGANAARILAQPDIDGCLIGGASLKSDEFLKIYNVAG